MIFKNKTGKHLNDSLTLILAFLFIIGALFLTQVNNPTGQVTSTSIETDRLVIGSEFTEYSNFNLSLNNVERISSTGSFVGEIGSSAKIYAVTESGAKLLITELIIDEDSQSNSVVTSNVVASKPTKSDDSLITKDNKTKENKKNDDELIIEENESTNTEITNAETSQSETETLNETELSNESAPLNETENSTNDSELIEEESLIDETTTNNETISKNETTTNETESDINNTTELNNETDINETQPITNETITNETTNNNTNTTTNETTNNDSIRLFEFTNNCVQTCDLMNVNIKEIIIEVDAGKLYLDELIYVHEVIIEENDTGFVDENNSEIKLINDVENITLMLNNNATINADDYFTSHSDVTFDAKSSEGYTFTNDDGDLIFTAMKIGEWDAKLYATDGTDLVASNNFKIIIIDDDNLEINDTQATNNETISNNTNTTINETEINETQPITNETITNETISDNTNTTINETEINTSSQLNETALDCSNPDPNKRPLDCLMSDDSSYFPKEDIFIENKKAKVVGKVTPIGNLLIEGDYVERTTSSPSKDDYQLGYANSRGDFVPTMWIDSSNGDLHLRGTLTETNSNIVYDSGYTAIANRRNILLATINKKTGDMILRGNVIPFRRSFE